jgi:uncharacterized glyoxalase superfamily protein PhnB
MDDPFKREAISVAVFYRDPAAALDWLEKAFGFVRSMVIRDASGALVHSEMKFGGGTIMVGSEWTDYVASPASTGGRNTQMVHLRIGSDIDGHCSQAKAAGATIVRELEDQFYGDRTYSARDPEGHVWSFGQLINVVSREEAEAASGLTIEGWY